MSTDTTIPGDVLAQQKLLERMFGGRGEHPDGDAGGVDDAFDRALSEGRLGGFHAKTDAAACLLPLLQALDWRGEVNHVAESLPHFADALTWGGLRNVLANLNYVTRPVRLVLEELDPRLIPCLFVANGGPVCVVTARDGARFEVFNGATRDSETLTGEVKGTAYVLGAVEASEPPPREAAPWFQTAARKFRSLIWQTLGITFLSSLLAMVMPLFIMAIYDRVVAARSMETLYGLLIGVALAFITDACLRFLRARMLAYVGGRMDMIIGSAVFKQILYLPAMMTERPNVGSQVERLRQFETVREFFTGPLAGVCLELPFVLLFLAAIAAIAGPLAWIPVILICLYGLMATIFAPILRAKVRATSDARGQRQILLIELLRHMRIIKQNAAERTWSERFRTLSAKTAAANFETSVSAYLVQSLAQTLMLVSGMAVMALGAMRVLDGAMTVGALIATIILVWRVLSPLQLAFISATRLEQVRLSIRQINQLMRLTPERDPDRPVTMQRIFHGGVIFDRVSVRYNANSNPALLGVSFTVQPGETVAVTGPSGSGKSTILKLVAGLVQPQAGNVMVDGLDIRQLDPGELRRSIAYVPQRRVLFHGTVAQNLRLADPTASDEVLEQACRDANVLDEINAMPQGMDTRFGDNNSGKLPGGLQQLLILARAYVRRAPLLLLDEPASNLDDDGDAALMEMLKKLRGETTIIMVTHRPSHMRLADRLLYLERGRVVHSGPPDDVLAKIFEARK